MDMAIQRDDKDEREARMDILIERFQEAEKRALLKRGIALWTQTEMQSGTSCHPTRRCRLTKSINKSGPGTGAQWQNRLCTARSRGR